MSLASRFRESPLAASPARRHAILRGERTPAPNLTVLPDEESFMSPLPTRRDFLKDIGLRASAGVLLAPPPIAAPCQTRPRCGLGRTATGAEGSVRQLPRQLDRSLPRNEAGPGRQVGQARRRRAGPGGRNSSMPATCSSGGAMFARKRSSPKPAGKSWTKITAGRLGLVALHSAHWSTPFVEAMYERTRRDVERQFPADGPEKVEITYAAPPQQYTVPKADARVTPYVDSAEVSGGSHEGHGPAAVLLLPGLPSRRQAQHDQGPEAGPSRSSRASRRSSRLPHTEMYDEPFHVPEPDAVLLEERWAGGEWFRSGCVWELGKGKVFYFRPGHETFAVYKEKPVLQILENAARWLALRTE